MQLKSGEGKHAELHARALSLFDNDIAEGEPEPKGGIVCEEGGKAEKREKSGGEGGGGDLFLQHRFSFGWTCSAIRAQRRDRVLCLAREFILLAKSAASR